MRQRRDRRKTTNSLIKNLNLLEKLLSISIIILLFVFIFSPIKVKKSTNHSNNELESIAENNNTESDEQIAQNIEDTNTLETEKNTSSNEVTVPQSKDKTINMAFTGDIMCHNTIYNDAYNSTLDDYDFSYIFDNIKYYLQTPDITIGNLETTFAGKDKKYSSYPQFNTPESLAYTLKKLGFDVVSTANNHCYDTGYAGIESTIKYLDDADISHTGTYTSEEEQNKILIKNVKGLKIAFLSFTYGTNGIKVPEDKTYSVNLIDESLILKQLGIAKEQNPDLIVTCMHWGVEYQTTPNSEQKKLADFLFENGTDIIIGNHPHVIQPMEKRQITLSDGTTKDGFVVYSLGNFLADQNKQYTRDSAILNLSVTKKEDGEIIINSATYTPIYTYKDTSQKTQKFKIIDLKNVVASYDAGYTDGITSSMYNTFSTELSNIKKLLGDEIKAGI